MYSVYFAHAGEDHSAGPAVTETVETHTVAETTAAPEHADETGILGVNAGAFIIQLVTFVLVFFILKRFAFDRILAILSKRYEVIEEGVRHGVEMQKERERIEAESKKVIREARHDADRIIGDAQKESREIIREAEKSAGKKAEMMLADAEIRIHEETEQARRKLEKDIVGLVSEATEAVVEQKVDARADADLIDKAIKRRKK